MGNQPIEDWLADDRLPSRIPQPDGASSTRRLVSGVALRTGDEIRIEGVPEAPETAALDYVEVLQ